MRARIKELDALVGEAADEWTRPSDESAPCLVRGADTRDSLIAEDPTRTREAAEHRLREVVAALETNPVELLRLRAGAGSTQSMTMDLSAAKDLSDDVARVLEGRRGRAAPRPPRSARAGCDADAGLKSAPA